MTIVALQVNGRAIETDVEPRQHLGDFVREDLLLTGTHLGCEHGVCGACTVLIDGAPARSCISYTAALGGMSVTTIEGLADDDVMVSLREAFSAEHGLQCGFCTPGMLIMARDIVLRRPGADAQTIRHELAGNLCRCTGYVGIVRAIRRVADARRDLAPVITRARAVDASSDASPLVLPLAPRRAGAVPAPATAATSSAGALDLGATALRNPVEFDEDFDVPAPREAVWTVVMDPSRVVTCLPGARLAAPSDGRSFEAEMTVKLGPIEAVFGGTGRLAADRATWSGTIDGTGSDRRSATRIQARLAFRLDEIAGGATTRVKVHVAYALQGPLAQMSRSGIARDLAGRMTRTFATNLAATLSGATPISAAAPLNAGALAVALLKGWLIRALKRLRPRF